MTYRHTEDMGEISGFGGGYEACCQDMLEAGVNWLNEHKEADLKVLSSPQIYGVIKLGSEDTEKLSKAVIDAAKGEATGAQHHAVMSRLMWIAANGWEAYCTELRKHERETAPTLQTQERAP